MKIETLKRLDAKFLLTFGSTVIFTLFVSVTNADSPREKNNSNETLPNIVYVMADDMGVGDVKCFGKDLSKAQTPNIDRLAKDGMMFTDAHAPVSHCIPTRIAIMTGRYAFRFKPPRPDGPWGYLNPRLKKDQHTLGKMLQSAGYHTGYIGKWHLGVKMQTTNRSNQGPSNVDYSKPLLQGPNDHGFNESFILPGSLDMYPYAFVKNHHWVGNVKSRKGWGSAFNRVGPAADDFEDHKVLDTFSSEAESFIEDRADDPTNPFFLYFALTAPHTPTSPHAKFRGKSRLGLYGDFLMETDDCLGRIVAALEKHNLTKNTLVIFASDHGAAAYAGNIAKATKNQFELMQDLGHFSSGIYRGFKFSAYEGGTRIPFVVKWPGKIKSGSTSNSLVGLNDLMATFGEIANVEFKDNQAPDSESFLASMTGRKNPKSRTELLCRSTNSFSIRKENWKLILCPGSGCAGNYGNSPARNEAWNHAMEQFGHRPSKTEVKGSPFVQLFDLQSDPTESKNLAAANPKLVAELYKSVENLIRNGRSNRGIKLKNDREFDLLSDVPKFVLEINPQIHENLCRNLHMESCQTS